MIHSKQLTVTIGQVFGRNGKWGHGLSLYQELERTWTILAHISELDDMGKDINSKGRNSVPPYLTLWQAYCLMAITGSPTNKDRCGGGQRSGTDQAASPTASRADRIKSRRTI